MFNLAKIILLFSIVTAFSGCMLARVLVSEELLMARGLGLRAVTTRTATRLAIPADAAALRNISRLRIKLGTSSKPVLYLPEYGANKPIFQLLNQSTVKVIRTGEVFPLPFRIFRVNGLAKAELRSGPGVSYNLYKTLPKDKFVLVRDEVPGWFKVQADEIIGWVAAAAIIPAVYDDIVQDSKSGKPNRVLKVTYSKIECYNCKGIGTKPCEDCSQSSVEDCPSCKGKGKHKCTNCIGSGQNECLICKGQNKEGCPSCRGIGYIDCRACKASGYFDCRICHSTGKIPCAVCDGTLYTKCYYCFGTATVLKRKEN